MLQGVRFSQQCYANSVMQIMYVVCVVSPDMGKDTQSIYKWTQTG